MTQAAGLPCAHGGAILTGVLRAAPEDFRVAELLGFEAVGSGEHVLLHVEKRGANTEWVARRLAAFAGVPAVAVGFAGMKDRHAVARQYFTVQLAGRADPDWAALEDAEFRVLHAARHPRKLKRGALQGNRFALVLRGVRGDRAAASRVLDSIAVRGVPNYFGEQRFGRGGSNLAAARAMFAGRRVDRAQRGILLSAARSELFNAVLARRVEAGSWERAVPGDVFQLDGSGSIFGPVDADPSMDQRLATGDIHPTAPLWGRGELRTTGPARELEESTLAPYPDLCRGLEGAGLNQERRATRIVPRELSWSWVEEDALRVEFSLPAGAYATTVLQELCAWTDASRQAQENHRPDATPGSH